MPEDNFSLAYSNKVDRLNTFINKEAALAWLKDNELDLSDTPILIPYKDKNQRTKFLIPKDPDNCLRTMGAGTPKRNTNIFNRALRYAKQTVTRRNYVPHVDDFLEDSIPIESTGFIVVYQKDITLSSSKTSVGRQFTALYAKEKNNLMQQIKVTETNDGVEIPPAKFIQDLSALAIDLNLRSGMSYFIIVDKDGNETAYRHTFKEGVDNEKIATYLFKEKESAQKGHEIATPVRVQNNKTEHTHLLAFLKQSASGAALAFITAISAAVLVALILLPVLPAIVAAISAAVVALSIFLIGSTDAYMKAAKDNESTITFGDGFVTNDIASTSPTPPSSNLSHENKPTLSLTEPSSSKESEPTLSSAKAKLSPTEGNSPSLPDAPNSSASTTSPVPVAALHPTEKNKTTLSSAESQQDKINTPARKKGFSKLLPGNLKFSKSSFFKRAPESTAKNNEEHLSAGVRSTQLNRLNGLNFGLHPHLTHAIDLALNQRVKQYHQNEF